MQETPTEEKEGNCRASQQPGTFHLAALSPLTHGFYFRAQGEKTIMKISLQLHGPYTAFTGALCVVMPGFMAAWCLIQKTSTSN